MTTPQKPAVPASKPAAAPAPAQSTDTIKVESNDAVKTGIQIESNDAVQNNARPAPASEIDDSHPAGIVIETFVGVQKDIAWVKPDAVTA